jgi:hypothetical protein
VDAARDRRHPLQVAREMIIERGAEKVTMDGRARIAFLLDQHAIARASLDRNQPIPAGESTISRLHVRVLLGQARKLGHLAIADPAPPSTPLADGWQAIIERLCRTPSPSGEITTAR